MKWYFEVLKKYAVFEGRSRRKEYWMFILLNIIVGFILSLVEGMFSPQSDESVVAGVYQLAVILPTIAVAVRRMHDTDHSGWWILVPIVNLIFLVREGHRGRNRFGADPTVTTQTAEMPAPTLS